MPRHRCPQPPGLPRPPRGRPLAADRGATLVEYAFLLGLIVLVAVVAVVIFGDAVLGLFSRIVSAMPF